MIQETQREVTTSYDVRIRSWFPNSGYLRFLDFPILSEKHQTWTKSNKKDNNDRTTLRWSKTGIFLFFVNSTSNSGNNDPPHPFVKVISKSFQFKPLRQKLNSELFLKWYPVCTPVSVSSSITFGLFVYFYLFVSGNTPWCCSTICWWRNITECDISSWEARGKCIFV